MNYFVMFKRNEIFLCVTGDFIPVYTNGVNFDRVRKPDRFEREGWCHRCDQAPNIHVCSLKSYYWRTVCYFGFGCFNPHDSSCHK